jgi:tripartite-type tricarboxylate transporter receptor subunit TctC
MELAIRMLFAASALALAGQAAAQAGFPSRSVTLTVGFAPGGGTDTAARIVPLTLGMRFPNVFVVHPDVPAKNIAELVALAKSKPGEVTYASSGVGGAAHLAGELFKQRAGIDMVHVPYKGGGPAMADMLGGR